jgi:hypothetical protein
MCRCTPSWISMSIHIRIIEYSHRRESKLNSTSVYTHDVHICTYIRKYVHMYVCMYIAAILGRCVTAIYVCKKTMCGYAKQLLFRAELAFRASLSWVVFSSLRSFSSLHSVAPACTNPWTDTCNVYSLVVVILTPCKYFACHPMSA